VADLPILDLGNDTLIDQGNPLQLIAKTNISAKQISNINWTGIPIDTCSNPCLDQIIFPLNSNFISATLTTFNGCQVSDEIEIEVVKEFDLFIPNAFSPNGDGFNDQFTIYTEAKITNISSFKIFNRWGNLIFMANDIPPNLESVGWDGMYQNKLLDSGVFTYLIEIRMPDGALKSWIGDVTLIK